MVPGLRKAIHVGGTLNDPSDTDRGWTVELALPWADLAEYAGRPVPPEDGDQWRVNFSRVEWDVTGGKRRVHKVPDTPEHNWVWSPQGVVDMHRRSAGAMFSSLPTRLARRRFAPTCPGQPAIC